ncbi:unnamed protein product [Lactuca saligna]|uniref:PHD finger protein ALFIN-LIKE n=1 Tax=Lactuca saligna TaxID=75948 RepID=A0AA35YGV0_LACSI|nr:unnamed protein product [Lactuca saligna]
MVELFQSFLQFFKVSSHQPVFQICKTSLLLLFMEMATISSSPRSVEEIFKDYSARRAGIVRALTYDVDEFYSNCDPEKENLCLYGHPNETWEVTVPAEEVPPELPEPALGINFARDGMHIPDWNERKRLFSLINDLPTVFEVVTERKPIKDKPNMDSGNKSRFSTKVLFVFSGTKCLQSADHICRPLQ